jgi:hypothetical protein
MTLIEPAPGREQTFSEVLEALTLGSEQLSIAEVVEAFGERGIGAMILILSLMAALPWPPGGKAVFGAPIILLAGELAVRRSTIWLPGWMMRASMQRATYAKALRRALKPVRFVENLTRPRLSALTSPLGEVAIGVACVLLAIMMALPIPFGDMLPAGTLILLSLGLMQRDGAMVIAGWIGVVVCGVYLVLVSSAVVHFGHLAWDWLTGLF